MRALLSVLLAFVLSVSTVHAQHPWLVNCGLGTCTNQHETCTATAELDATHGSNNETCLCEWDYLWDFGEHECEDACEYGLLLETTNPPDWCLDQTGFVTGSLDTLRLAIKVSNTYVNVKTAFGESPPDGDYDALSTWSTQDQEEDCYKCYTKNFTWYDDKFDELATTLDTTTGAPMTLVAWHGVRDEISATSNQSTNVNQNTSTTFNVYDGCLNIRQEEELTIPFQDYEIKRNRTVNSVKRFALLFPAEMKICTEVEVQQVAFTEVLVNETVICNDTTGGFVGYLEFLTFATAPFKLNTTDGGFTFDIVDNECLDVAIVHTEDSDGCDTGTATESPCEQKWTATITPVDSMPCDVCEISGIYEFTGHLYQHDNSSGDVEFTDNTQSFNITIDSADFCTQVIAEAGVEATLDAYHDSDYALSGTNVYLPNTIVYMRAMFTSDEASICNVTDVNFTASYYEPDSSSPLEDSEILFDISTSESGFTFTSDWADDWEGNGSYILDFNFNLTTGLGGFFDLMNFTDRLDPFRIELCLFVEIVWCGHEDDLIMLLSMNEWGIDAIEARENPFLEILEMVDPFSKRYALTLKKDIVYLPPGYGVPVDQLPEVPEIKQIEPEVVASQGSTGPSTFSIVTFILSIAVLLGMVGYTAFICNNKNKYSKIITKVDAETTDIEPPVVETEMR